MESTYHKIKSTNLSQDFEFKVYGKSGKPLLIFPCSNGRFFDYENFGMIDTISEFINKNEIIAIAVDSRDHETWLASIKNQNMGLRQRAYELAIVNEVIPFINKTYNIKNKYITTGNSWGAYHAMNFALKFPIVFDVAISLSGAYSLTSFIGAYYDENVYYNDMLMYMPNLNDENIINQLKNNYYIICHGLGTWEICNHEAATLASALSFKGIPYWYDVWGAEYPHDWPSWKIQIIKFLNQLKNGVIMPNRVKKFI